MMQSLCPRCAETQRAQQMLPGQCEWPIPPMLTCIRLRREVPDQAQALMQIGCPGCGTGTRMPNSWTAEGNVAARPDTPARAQRARRVKAGLTLTSCPASATTTPTP